MPRTTWLPMYLWLTAKQCLCPTLREDFAKVVGNLQFVQVIRGSNAALLILLACESCFVHTIRITVKSYSKYKHQQRQASGRKIVPSFLARLVAAVYSESQRVLALTVQGMQQNFCSTCTPKVTSMETSTSSGLRRSTGNEH